MAVPLRFTRGRLALIVVSASALVVGSLPAQGPSATTIGIDLPTTSREALSSANGLDWNVLRRNGLSLATTGRGDLTLVVHVMQVKNGRIVGHWASASFTVTAGRRTTISGRYLPGADAVGNAWRCKWYTAGAAVSAGAVAQDLQTEKAGFAGRNPPGNFVIVVLPAAHTSGGSDTSTNPLFFKSESHGDGL